MAFLRKGRLEHHSSDHLKERECTNEEENIYLIGCENSMISKASTGTVLKQP